MVNPAGHGWPTLDRATTVRRPREFKFKLRATYPLEFDKLNLETRVQHKPNAYDFRD